MRVREKEEAPRKEGRNEEKAEKGNVRLSVGTAGPQDEEEERPEGC